MCHTKNYWRTEHDIYIQGWIEAVKTNDLRNQNHYYNKLQGAINYMATQIGRKYYNLPYGHEFIIQAISHLFITLPKFNPERAKAYSFCGTVIKNELYSLIVKRNKIEHGNISLDDNTNEYPIELEYDNEYEDNIILNDINHNKLINYLNNYQFNNIDEELNIQYQQYLKDMIEFLINNKGSEYDILGLIEYIAFSNNIPNNQSKKFLYNNFGVGHLIEKRIEDNNYDDDYLPIENPTNKKLRLNKIRNNNTYVF